MTTGFVTRFKGKIFAAAGSLFQFGKGGANFGASGNLSCQAGAQGNGNDTTEDTLFSYALPANSLDQVGRSLQIVAWGSFANNAHSKNAKLYFGSEVVGELANVTTGGIGWYLEMNVVKTGANTQSISGQLIAGTTHGGCTVQAGAETDTAAITIKVTGQTGTASASDVVCDGFQVTAMN